FANVANSLVALRCFLFLRYADMEGEFATSPPPRRRGPLAAPSSPKRNSSDLHQLQEVCQPSFFPSLRRSRLGRIEIHYLTEALWTPVSFLLWAEMVSCGPPVRRYGRFFRFPVY